MQSLDAYVIPVSSLRPGRNELEFSVDWRFFQQFESSPVQQGSFRIPVVFDKYTDHWHLLFEVTGHVDTECDRCLAPIALPVAGTYELFVRFDEDQDGEDETGPEILNVPRETTRLDVTQYLYEFVVLSVPMVKRFDCESVTPKPCDAEMLAKLSGHSEEGEADERWSMLKDIRIGGSTS